MLTLLRRTLLGAAFAAYPEHPVKLVAPFVAGAPPTSSRACWPMRQQVPGPALAPAFNGSRLASSPSWNPVFIRSAEVTKSRTSLSMTCSFASDGFPDDARTLADRRHGIWPMQG